jgi:hypothetical protein
MVKAFLQCVNSAVHSASHGNMLLTASLHLLALLLLLCRDAWQALQLSRDPAVLCELVKCLPALIRALGPAITVQELLPSLAGLLQAHLAWIAGQLVAVMAELLELLPPSSQDMLLKVRPEGCSLLQVEKLVESRLLQPCSVARRECLL